MNRVSKVVYVLKYKFHVMDVDSDLKGHDFFVVVVIQAYELCGGFRKMYV